MGINIFKIWEILAVLKFWSLETSLYFHENNILCDFFKLERVIYQSLCSGYPALEGKSRISLDCNGDSIPWNTHGKYNIWQIQRDGSFKVTNTFLYSY